MPRSERRRRYGLRRPLTCCARLAVGSVLLASCGHAAGNAIEKPPSAAQRKCGPNGLLSEGERLPDDCILETLDGGQRVTLGVLRHNKPVVINFWATWCPYCIKEMPDLERTYTRLQNRVEVIGLDLLNVQG